MIWYIVSSIAMGLAAGLVYAYYHKKGHFKGLEEVKYQIFHEDEEK